jgi:plasmid maintenance system antidote protein VapI
MNEKLKIYKELSAQYTLEELSDAVFMSETADDSKSQKEEAEFIKMRLERRVQLSEREQLFSNLLSLKYQMKAYIKGRKFDKKMRIGNFLTLYLKYIGRTQKDLSEEINVHPSRLNRIIKGKEKLGKALVYRLENHSGDLIPALYWWKVMQIEIEQEIMTEKKERELEKKHVKRVAYI